MMRCCGFQFPLIGNCGSRILESCTEHRFVDGRVWWRDHALRDGSIVKAEARLLLDGGAYASSSLAVIANAACFAFVDRVQDQPGSGDRHVR